MMKSKRVQVYRHAPAFILLFLARENLYGAALYNKMQKEIPFCFADSAIIYRTLQVLEEEGAVKSYWDTDSPGPAKKWYQISSKGLEKLAEYKQDIERRKNNLEFFLYSYEQICQLKN
ncbi:transcriptional regulator, PadR-like family [Desulfofarcimen acetoxidans DSM 771]|jgi:DNA-binding PadR family transcriptional regulator|uniref:Transcriptional regulator, PadR-like family n=1 Tax=Desulfofarcimen acetoxidans (strain ATCC 49208 / DSM 771 / KCTC 5769 / VKM B-1644 / 5575) TaxID=485916 RepID=C8W023_DESAS|nr:helix-turn-helix transcriptional regulator [Desulfofarcimen acetoxidans]ACV64991.1 transcriptional regulator, PadR-like family [Desulfofarcimen acetoxidans DSM 771]